MTECISEYFLLFREQDETQYTKLKTLILLKSEMLWNRIYYCSISQYDVLKN